MFTGLVEMTGVLVNLHGEHLTLRPSKPFADPQYGESVAVNGCCLTLERDDHLLLSGGAGGEGAKVEERQVAACPGDEVTLANPVVVGMEEVVLGELQLRHRNLAYEASLLVEGEESCLPYL